MLILVRPAHLLKQVCGGLKGSAHSADPLETHGVVWWCFPCRAIEDIPVWFPKKFSGQGRRHSVLEGETCRYV